MESNYNTTWSPFCSPSEYALIKGPKEGLYVRVQAGIDPIGPGATLYVSTEELEALRYRRITIEGIIESKRQRAFHEAKIAQLRELQKRRAEVKEGENKPLKVKVTLSPRGHVYIFTLDDKPLRPGSYTVEFEKVEILK